MNNVFEAALDDVTYWMCDEVEAKEEVEEINQLEELLFCD